MGAKSIMIEQLERYMRIAKELKTEFEYDKSFGKWYWRNHDDDPNNLYGPFDTFWQSLQDVVEPYIQPGLGLRK